MDELIKLLMAKVGDADWLRINRDELYYAMEIKGVYIEVYNNRLCICEEKGMGKTINTPAARDLWVKLNNAWTEQNKRTQNNLIAMVIGLLTEE